MAKARLLALLLSCALSTAPAVETPLNQAAQLQGDAESALRAGQWRKARQAADSAWAQGRHTAAVLALRTRGESAVAFPPSLSGGVNWPVDYEKEKIEPESLGGRLQGAAKAVALFAQWGEAATPKRSVTEFAELGTTVLLSGSRLLRYATEHEPSLAEHGPAIAELRRLMRETAAAVQGAATADESDDKEHFYLLAATYLPYWSEAPAEAVAAWRELLARRFTGRNRMNLYATVRGQLLDRRGGQEYGGLPWLVAWHGEAPAELAKLWSDFRDSLLQSKSQIEVLDGRLLETADLADRQRLRNDPAVGNLIEQLWTSREMLLREGLAYEYLWSVLTSSLGAFHPTRASLEKRWLIYYLDNAKRDEFRIPGMMWHVDELTHEEGADLYRHWLAHKQRLAREPEFYAAYETRLFQKFPDLAGPPPADTITVKQFWSPPELGDIVFHAISRPVWAEGRLWLSLTYHTPNPPAGSGYHYRILEVEVPGLQVVNRVEVPGDGMAGLLLVRPDALYCTNRLTGQENGIRRYDRKTKEWSTLPLPDQNYWMAYADDERLVAAYEFYDGTGESGIVQWTRATGEVTVLSSNRRRPAQNQFDNCARYDIRHVFAAPDGAPAVLIDDADRSEHAYTYDAATKRWNPFLPTKFRVLAQSLDTATLFVSPECGVALIRGKGEPIDPWFGSRFPKPAEPFKPQAPAELKDLTYNIYSGQPIALAAGRLWSLRMKPAPGGAGEILVLSAFDHDQLLLERPIRFEAPKAADQLRAKHVTTDETKPPIDMYMDLVGTDAGLFFRNVYGPGYWFLPIGEAGLEQAGAKPK
ncbi:MAG TPA: hypothetical protein VGO11_13080 [Chthoniobacteraceae bacterium]|nr:hypothetical protein [Chthoniobacteraceae bacterium]